MKRADYDDGRTVADMNVEGMPWYRSKKARKNGKEVSQLDLSRKERRAVVWAGVKAVLPAAICAVAGMTAAIIIVALWVGL